MAYIRLIHDPLGQPLTVHRAKLRANQICEETGEGVVRIKDASSQKIIGFERLDYRPEPGAQENHFEVARAVA